MFPLSAGNTGGLWVPGVVAMEGNVRAAAAEAAGAEAVAAVAGAEKEGKEMDEDEVAVEDVAVVERDGKSAEVEVEEVGGGEKEGNEMAGLPWSEEVGKEGKEVEVEVEVEAEAEGVDSGGLRRDSIAVSTFPPAASRASATALRV